MLRPHPTDVVVIQTEGDQARDVSLATIGGQGAFTKEIQRALLSNSVDVAVHSLKDLPTEPVEGLTIAAVPPRAPVDDVLVARAAGSLDALPAGARVATGSLRRRALLRHRRPDLDFVDIRGNVDTRLRMLHDAGLDALVLARAGLERLGLESRITQTLDPSWMTPAVGQGALGIECRSSDAATLAAVRPLDHAPSRAAVLAERALLRHLGGGCQMPIGGSATVAGDRLCLRGVVIAPDGSQRIDGDVAGAVGDAEELGRQLAERLNSQGAKDLLQMCRADGLPQVI